MEDIRLRPFRFPLHLAQIRSILDGNELSSVATRTVSHSECVMSGPAWAWLALRAIEYVQGTHTTELEQSATHRKLDLGMYLFRVLLRLQ